MVALSRLKATFEACLELFRQNMKHWPGSRLAKKWHAETVPPRVKGTDSRGQRCTRYCTLLDKSNIGLRKMHERGRSPQSACPTHEGNLVLKQGENKFFEKWRWLGQRQMDKLCEWCHSLVSPHKFNVDLIDSPSIQSRSPLDVPCHCSFTQPNTFSRSLTEAAGGIPLS